MAANLIRCQLPIATAEIVSVGRLLFATSASGSVRGLRVAVATMLGLLSAGRSRDEILKAYPYLEAEVIDQCLAYTAWRMEERDIPLATA